MHRSSQKRSFESLRDAKSITKLDSTNLKSHHAEMKSDANVRAFPSSHSDLFALFLCNSDNSKVCRIRAAIITDRAPRVDVYPYPRTLSACWSYYKEQRRTVDDTLPTWPSRKFLLGLLVLWCPGVRYVAALSCGLLWSARLLLYDKIALYCDESGRRRLSCYVREISLVRNFTFCAFFCASTHGRSLLRLADVQSGKK